MYVHILVQSFSEYPCNIAAQIIAYVCACIATAYIHACKIMQHPGAHVHACTYLAIYVFTTIHIASYKAANGSLVHHARRECIR